MVTKKIFKLKAFPREVDFTIMSNS